MEDENQQNEKKFEIIEEYHRQKPKQKIYKIRIYMVGNMCKAQQKLRMKFERQPNQSPNSASNLERTSGNDLVDDIFDQMTQQEQPQSHHNNNQRQPFQEKPIKIYEDFKNRGKHENFKFHFSREKQRITIIIMAKSFFNELKLKQFDLLMIYQSFTKIWQEEYIQIMQAFLKYWKQFKNPDQYNIKFQFVAIDIIGVTFQVLLDQPSDSIQQQSQLKSCIAQKIPFPLLSLLVQTKSTVIVLLISSFEQKSTQQIISYVEIHSSNNNNVQHHDFYTSMRLGFIDDINNSGNDLWKRMITRFWVFYQLHCLNRGMSDYEQFNKRTLGRVHFHPVRMKKFQLVFPFPLLHKNIIDEKKQGMIFFTFYLDDKQINIGQNGLEFRLNVNIVQHYGILTFEQKGQIFNRLSKEESFSLIEKPGLALNEIFEFWMKLKFDEKISKAFAKFETIVSFFIDKIAFNDVRPNISQPQYTFNDVRHNRPQPPEQPENEKIIEIVRQLEPYDESKNVQTGQKAGQFIHYHSLVLELKHKHSIQGTYSNINLPRYIDQISFFKLSKKKRKYNTAREKEEPIEKVDLVINDDFKKYLNQILKIKPLRQCYKEVMDYVERVAKIIYMPFKDSNDVKIVVSRQLTLSLIISNISKLLDMGNHHLRKSQITIIHDKDPLLVRGENEEDLIAQITFNIKELKIYWIKRLPEGYIIVRMFQKRIEIVKDLNLTTTIEINYNDIEKTSDDLIKELRNILMKEFATLQNMMI